VTGAAETIDVGLRGIHGRLLCRERGGDRSHAED